MFLKTSVGLEVMGLMTDGTVMFSGVIECRHSVLYFNMFVSFVSKVTDITPNIMEPHKVETDQFDQ